MVNVPTSSDNLKTKVDHLGVGKLTFFFIDLINVSAVVSKEVLKSTKFSTLSTKENNLENKSPDATTLIDIYQYNENKKKLERIKLEMLTKKTDVSGLLTNPLLNVKISKIQKKIVDESGSVTITVLNLQIGEAENKTPDLSGLVKKNSDLKKKLGTLASKGELLAEQDKIVKLPTFYSSYFRGKSHFKDYGAQDYFVFQPSYKCFEQIGNVEQISAWK